MLQQVLLAAFGLHIPPRMDLHQRRTLARRLTAVEAELQLAQRGLDGSPASRTRYARARQDYAATEREVIRVLGAREALALVEAREDAARGEAHNSDAALCTHPAAAHVAQTSVP